MTQMMTIQNSGMLKTSKNEKMETVKGKMMKTSKFNMMMSSALLSTLGLLMSAHVALAGQASTSATAGSNGWGPGTANATAGYTGDGRGVAKTDTRTGNVNLARGLAYGVDQNGISFSASNAVAPKHGPAVGTTFNVSVGRDGKVSTSFGLSVAGGSNSREVTAGGSSSTGSRFSSPVATATAGGRTGHGGFVKAITKSNSSRDSRLGRPRLVIGRR